MTLQQAVTDTDRRDPTRCLYNSSLALPIALSDFCIPTTLEGQSPQEIAEDLTETVNDLREPNVENCCIPLKW